MSGVGSSVMLIGNTGVGKSSLGCRLLGEKPFGPGCRFEELKFKVGSSFHSVTSTVSTKQGKFNGDGNDWTVIDTPGLGDSGGLDVDTVHMADIGQCLNSEPVKAVVFVLNASMFRIDFTLKRLINIIVTKVHPSDYDKLCIVLNQWSHNDYWREERQRISGLTEAQHQERRKDIILDALGEYAKQGLKLSSYHIQGFRNRIFFLNSNYRDDSVLDKTAFEGFSDWCEGNNVVNRSIMNQDTGDVYVELKYKTDEIKFLQDEAEFQQQQHLQEIARCEQQAAEDQALARERQRRAEEVNRLRIEVLQKDLNAQAKQVRAEAERQIEELRLEQANQQKRFDKEMATLQEARIREKEHMEKMNALRLQKQDAEWRCAIERKKQLEAQAEVKRWQDEADRRKRGCFPSNAFVYERAKGQIVVSCLQAGDWVLSVDKAGRPFYDQVMFFGHQESAPWVCYQTLAMQTAQGVMHKLCLTPTHFVPTGVTFEARTFKYAEDVAVGDTLWVQEQSVMVAATITKVSTATFQGIFNPFTKGGLIVVNGVVASAHSHWLFDDLVPKAALSMLPDMYQLMFAPVFLVGRLVGVPRFSRFLEHYMVPHLHEWPGPDLLRQLASQWNALLLH